MTCSIEAGPIRFPLFFFAIEGLAADRTREFRGGRLYTGSTRLPVVVRAECSAVRIGAGPVEPTVFFVRTATHGLATCRAGERAGEQNDGSGEHRGKERGENGDLFLHEGFKRVLSTGYLFEPLFPLCRGHWIFKRIWSHVDERLAKRRRDE